jgi:hypothetical protein
MLVEPQKKQSYKISIIARSDIKQEKYTMGSKGGCYSWVNVAEDGSSPPLKLLGIVALPERGWRDNQTLA